MHTINFSPPQSLAEFWHTNDFYQFIVGPIGSTKTTNCIFKMLYYSLTQNIGPDGYRRSRWVIVRPTLQQIKTTVLKDIEQWLSPICSIRVSDSMIKIRVNDVISDWYMIPLQHHEDQRRLLSMQLTGAYFNEFREIPFNFIADVVGRLGRYPSMEHGGCSWTGIIADSNPPPKDSPYYKFLVEEKPDNVHFTHQPGGLDPEADWRAWLRPDYYENIAAGRSGDWVDVHVHSKWGQVKAGQAVYKSSFEREFHVAKGRLTPIPGCPLIIGMDFARWPAAIICQMDPTGRLLVFEELEQENSGVENFVKIKLIPLLKSQKFNGYHGYVIGDPSGNQRSQIGEESVYDMFKRMGLQAYPAQTNNIEPRIRAVEKFLLQQRGGKPALIIDPVGCPQLVRGFEYAYRYRTRKDGMMEDIPDKSNRPYPDLHDALQYACLGTAQNIMARMFVPTRPQVIASPSPRGWT